MRVIPYAFAIGSIMYAMHCKRPNVSYALSVTSMYQSDYGEAYWTVVKNLLKYFRRTKELFLVFGGEEELVETCYTNASFQIDGDGSRSQFSFVFYLNGGAVSWKSSKQYMIVDSTMKVEYIVASEDAKEAIWIRNFVSVLGVLSLVRLVLWISMVIIADP
jgi:hypothetical protein